MKLRDYFLFILSGLALHQTSSITQNMPTGWGYLAGLVIGVEGTFPVFVILMRRLKVPDDVIIRASAAYQVAFLLVGCGVALGWLLDILLKIDREK